MRHTPPLLSGDTIGIFAPSSRINEDNFMAGTDLLQERGFKLHIHEQTYKHFHQSAGMAIDKAQAYADLLNAPYVKMIMAAAGGNRVSQSLAEMTAHRGTKLLAGFSDVTNLHMARYKLNGSMGIFSPNVQTLPRIPTEQVDYLFQLLAGETPDYPLDHAAAFRTGEGEGVLMGGTLAMLCSLCGTGYMPDMTGSILYIEDVNEELSRVDRMLWQLRQAIPFKKLSGIIFGEFLNCTDSGNTPFGFTLQDIIREHTEDLNLPVIINAPFGHGSHFYSLPFGTRAKLVAGKKNALHLLEPLTRA